MEGERNVNKKTLKIDYIENTQTQKSDNCHVFLHTKILTANRNEDHTGELGWAMKLHREKDKRPQGSTECKRTYTA